MQSDEVLRLVHGTRAHSPQLLHMGADAKEQSHVDAKGSDVGASLTADPENTEVAVVVELDELGLVDGTDAELALDGRDQGRSLEERAGKELEDTGKLCLAAGNLVVEAHDSHVLLSSTLLGFDESRGAIDAHNQTTGDFRIESTAMAGLFNA